MDFKSENMAQTMERNMFHDGKSVKRSTFLYENSTISYFISSGSTALNTDSNTTTAYIMSNTTYLERDETVAVLEMTVSATILFLAIVGNSCVILSLATRRKRLSRMHLMILHLSLADLFVAFFNVLPQLAWDITHTFIGGHFLCVSVKYVQVVAMYASSYVLLATAVDRFYAICHPFVTQMWTARHAHTLAVVAWAASLFFSLPQVFIFSYRLREDVPGVSIYDCWAQFNPEWTLRAYITWMTASIFVVPTCVLGILYGKITWVVWKAGKFEENMMTKFSPTNTHQNGDSKIASGRSSPRRSNHRKSDKQSLSAGPVDANRCSQVTRDLCKIGFDNVAVQKTNINQDASVLIKAPKVELFRPGENGGRKRNSTHAATQFTEQAFVDFVEI